MGKPPSLSNAYALTSDADLRALYADWADTYEAGFGAVMGYQLPREVTLTFVGAGGCGPVLDFGAGTGLVADELAAKGVGPIDGVDLSAEMLDVARQKGIYRDLFAENILAPGHQLPAGRYDGIVSAGTFTHGHVGAEGLRPLLGFANPGALIVLSVNAKHFELAGFAAEIAALDTEISDFALRDVRIYDDRAAEEHRKDLAKLMVFRRA